MKYTCFCGQPTDNEEAIGRVVIHTCDACKKRIHREVLWESQGEQFDEDVVICPYCEHHYDNYDSLQFDEGETDEHECEVCGHKFKVTVRIQRTYSTVRSVCEMPDDWEGD